MSEPATTPDPSLVVVGSHGRRVVEGGKARMRPCDFRHPALLSEGELRRLRNQHAEFARQFSAKASAFLRLEFNLTLAELTTVPYARFTEALPDPAHLTLFKVEPLAGMGIISLPPPLGLAITNRMLGGKGELTGDSRPLTEIETGLLEDFLRMAAEEWCRQWPELADPRPLLVGHETNGRFLQTSPAAANMLAVTLDVALGESRQTLQIAMPFAALEASIRRSPAPRPREARPAAAPDTAALARRAASAGISLPAVADWKVASVTVRDVLHLRPGDVLELPGETLAQTRVSLTGRPLFVGTVGVRDGRVAIKIDRRLEPGDDGGPSAAGTADIFAPLLAR